MQVDVTFAGHDHKYERTCPVYMKSCLADDGNGTAGGPMHVVSASMADHHEAKDSGTTCVVSFSLRV